ncbi:MAG: Carboxylesterase type [Frankiales bacterium]|nr:Carboxylesterase type [Frankiales bacterium]
MDVTTVELEHGALRGTTRPSGGRLFAGIPFAAPPVADLRFRPPRPVTRWAGLRDATTFGAPPLQATGGAEDCLTLNVWTPSSPGPHPTLVWLFGGGFEAGSASPPGTDASVLADALQAVVVAPNYRLGVLGWLHLADVGGSEWAGSTNLGLQDVLAALEWTQANITAFGGDPRRVTLAGVSAGAFITGALLAQPSASDLFSRAILHSGSTGRTYTRAVASEITGDLLHRLGLSSVEQLQSVPGPRLLEVQTAVIDQDIGRRNLPGGRAWGVVIDGEVVTRDPHDAVRRGDTAGIDLLLGTTAEEVRLYQVMQAATFPPAEDAALIEEMRRAGHAAAEELLTAYRNRHPGEDLATLRARFLTDAIYHVPAVRLADDHTAAGGRAWMGTQTGSPLGPLLGACHGSDMAYLFDGPDVVGLLPRIPEEQGAIRDRMREGWRRFVHEGDPGWPRHSAGPATTLDYGTGRLVHALHSTTSAS